MTPKLVDLPDTGRFIVDTECAVYTLDLDDGYGAILDIKAEGEGKTSLPLVFFFDLVNCTIGEPLEFTLFQAEPMVWRSKSAVLGVSGAD